MLGDTAVRASDIVRLTPLIDTRGKTLHYGVKADLRFDGKYVTYTIGECHVDDRDEAEAENSAYIEKLLVLIHAMEARP